MEIFICIDVLHSLECVDIWCGWGLVEGDMQFEESPKAGACQTRCELGLAHAVGDLKPGVYAVGPPFFAMRCRIGIVSMRCRIGIVSVRTLTKRRPLILGNFHIAHAIICENDPVLHMGTRFSLCS